MPGAGQLPAASLVPPSPCRISPPIIASCAASWLLEAIRYSPLLLLERSIPQNLHAPLFAGRKRGGQVKRPRLSRVFKALSQLRFAQFPLVQQQLFHAPTHLPP